MWKLRRRFWNRLSVLKFKANLPRPVPEPSEDRRRIVPIELQKRYPSIGITRIPVADHVPPDETMKFRLLFCKVQAFLYRRFPPTQPGLPQIHPDPRAAVNNAYTRAHRGALPAPELPEEYARPIDLGYLAVAGPYACYLQAADDGFEWDFRLLGDYEHHPGLLPLRCRVLFRADEETQTLSAVEIDCALGVCKPGDQAWPQAQRLALCAATNHLSLIRHFNWVHLVTVANFAMVTRNNLSADHPVRRLLWPHMWGTQYSNELVTEILLMKGGDFESVFSFTHTGLWKLFEDSYTKYDIRVLDPTLDARERKILEAGFALPYLANRQAHWDVFHRHTQRFLRLYYESDEALRADESLQQWLGELAEHIPGGIRIPIGRDATINGIAWLTAGFIYFGSVEHDVLGTGLWNYQLWYDVQPTRMYRSGRRESVDVYQRLVNYNFILNVHRSPLCSDFSHMARDGAGKEAFRRFLADLEALQRELDAEEPACWKVSPRILESGVNG